ncbi:MAG: thiamine-phosphate kinase [Sterolibacterium sp.]|jgi:thiamine-monophosphate kinase|nr:thiamine-phosphate kinase [Sterolibacterium sp.]
MPSEFALIARHFTRPTRHSVLGVGDDAAIVRPAAGHELAISTDMLVCGTHFLPDTDPAALGWKTLAVNVSDLAAMGAHPRWALLAAALPADYAANEPWIAAFADGFFACADAFDIDVIGGDTTCTTHGALNFCVTIFGEVESQRALLRSGAQEGDEIWVSGSPGLAALGLAHLQGRCTLPPAQQPACLHALHRPQPRVALGRALQQHHLATAAIDISDGLLADLGHILEQSAKAATLHLPLLSHLPHTALNTGVDAALAQNCLLAGGDDYELLFTAAPAQHAAIRALSAQLNLPLTCIGQITHTETIPAQQLQLLDADGKNITPARRGYDHFA